MNDDITLIDASLALGEQMRTIIPWLEPAIKTLCDNRFGVEQRHDALQRASIVLLDEFIDGSDPMATFDHKIRAQVALGAYIYHTAAHLASTAKS